ncbi:septum formation inhibitor Maf [Polaribacter sargassicola]|uniref:septum formation inhibitor Maf n=1 Tax=Polaribacter sargassicola TaxID=2836891 RepID=UPI001F43386B|nr:septum formation inhibitor Maf [Polaribacter sp. DS7-9]MCG1037183.1 septum formation inhibitor Maf [Polaribacter sp. DS7-9]
MNSILKIFIFPYICFIIACKSDKEPQKTETTSIKKTEVFTKEKQFNDYWYSGKAELNSYELKQSRYGEIRKGEVVLVFVTEPFSLSKQVKLDNAKKAGNDNVSVMKLNNVRKFTTGIYDYSIVSSTFTPVNTDKHPYTLKLNTSIQEWCGHTFTQLNLKENNYQFQQFSYFEKDGDTKKNISKALLEDELMTRIRLNKGQLPLGEIDLIFSTIYSRFAYKDLQATKAKISKTETNTTLNYKIDYLKYNRTLTINVEKEFPYKILSWTEDNGDGLITEAILKKSLKEPYWNQKKVSDEIKRKELKLMN